jgi:ribosomal-protein-alanine N-acetyltransferase
MVDSVRRVSLPNPPIPNPQSLLPVHIRWMIARDQLYVLGIEHASFDCPWSERDFIREVQRRDRDGAGNVIAMVAETEDTLFVGKDDPRRGTIAGFMVYELKRWRLDLLNFAVHPSFRRRRVGTQMIAKLASKLSPNGRTSIRAEVRETNVAAQLFFRACAFRHVKTLRGCYDDTPEDAYRMVYRPFGPGHRCEGEQRG